MTLGDEDSLRITRAGFDQELSRLKSWLRDGDLVPSDTTEWWDGGGAKYPFHERYVAFKLFGTFETALLTRDRVAKQAAEYLAWVNAVLSTAPESDKLILRTIANPAVSLDSAASALRCIAASEARREASWDSVVDVIQDYNRDFVQYNVMSNRPASIDVGAASIGLRSLIATLHARGALFERSPCGVELHDDNATLDSLVSRIRRFELLALTGTGRIVVNRTHREVFASAAYQAYDSEHHAAENARLAERLLTSAQRTPPPEPRTRRLALLYSSGHPRIGDTDWLSTRSGILSGWISAAGIANVIALRSVTPRADGTFDLRLELTVEGSQQDAAATLRRMSRAYWKRWKVGLEERLLWKSAHVLEYPVGLLRMSFDAPCFGVTARLIEGKLDQRETMCMSGSASVRVARVQLQKMTAASLGPSAVRTISGGEDFAETVFRVVRTYLAQKGVDSDNQVQRLAIENNFVSVFVSHMRNQVIRGGDYWENVQLSFRLLPDQHDYRLSLVADGQYGAGMIIPGLSRPPSYRAYRDMEPRYKQELQRYTSELLYRIRDALGKGK